MKKLFIILGLLISVISSTSALSFWQKVEMSNKIKESSDKDIKEVATFLDMLEVYPEGTLYLLGIAITDGYTVDDVADICFIIKNEYNRRFAPSKYKPIWIGDYGSYIGSKIKAMKLPEFEIDTGWFVIFCIIVAALFCIHDRKKAAEELQKAKEKIDQEKELKTEEN